jgi:hypothetical protein
LITRRNWRAGDLHAILLRRKGQHLPEEVVLDWCVQLR